MVTKAYSYDRTAARKTKPKKAIPGESLYTDFDEDLGEWCVFGDKSGFCYSTWSSKIEADRDKKKMEHNNKGH